MLNEKTATLLKKIATKSSTLKIQTKLETSKQRKRKINQKNQKDDKHILNTRTSLHAKEAI